VAVVLAGLLRWRAGTELTLALVGGPLAGLWLWGRVEAVRLYQHRRALERPLSAALAPFLGVEPREVEGGLSIDPGYADTGSGEHVAALELPDHWAATRAQREQVQEVISARLGVDVRYQWRTADHPMIVNLTRAAVPPAVVPFAEVRAYLESLPGHLALLGKDAQGEYRNWDRSAEDPHVLLSAGSRRGKTTLLLLLAAQDIRRGADHVTAIDPKRLSLLALANVAPGVRLVNDPRDVPGMWAAVADFAALVGERYDELAKDPTREHPRALLILDEVSQLSAMFARHWRKIKAPGDPTQPPVWDDVATVLWMGAQANCHVIIAGQRIDFKLLGGLLGSLGLRLLAGYSVQDFKRLVGLTPVVPSQRPRGRFLYFDGSDDLAWLQLVKASPDEIRDWILAGRATSDLGQNLRPATGDTLIGLAAGAAHLGLSVSAFRKRLEREGRPAGEFRAGNQPAWLSADLDTWAGRVSA
jgi:hypothetical protein